MFKKEGMDAVILPHDIDSPFINQLEQKNENLKFLRIDTDVTDIFKEESEEQDEEKTKADSETLAAAFKKALENDKLEVKAEKLKDASVASMITITEESRRMQDMMRMYSMYGMDSSMFGGESETLVVNTNHPLVQYVLNHNEGENTNKICQQLYDLAKLSHGSLTPDRMTAFISRSNEIMLLLAEEK